MIRHCTCGGPPTFDLTQAFLSQEPDVSAPLSLNFQSILRDYGFAFVTLRPSRLLTVLGKSKLSSTLQSHTSWTDILLNLFQETNECQNKELVVPGGTYREAESGSSEGTIEPKESWEVQRCACRSSENKDSVEHQHVLYELTSLLHKVAVCARITLGLPQNVLLPEQGGSGPEHAVDLLRAFHYHTVPAVDDACFGSSPHTDWGSFTVVWQDDTGGLETYCHACQKWNPVPPPLHNDEVVSFVVHVGDVMSLSLALATQSMGGADPLLASPTSFVEWPSPLHRVVSPRKQPRVSLVYFAYPPPQLSISQVADELKGWCQQQKSRLGKRGNLIIPFEDYYLLQNQSTSPNGETSAASDQLGRILTSPLVEVLRDKWNQVQRSQY